jgi:cytochrome c oxidase cbb3-type subunit 4
MSHGTLSGIVIVVLMLSFIGIVLWAWSARAKRGFEEAARMPLLSDANVRSPEGPS